MTTTDRSREPYPEEINGPYEVENHGDEGWVVLDKAHLACASDCTKEDANLFAAAPDLYRVVKARMAFDEGGDSRAAAIMGITTYKSTLNSFIELEGLLINAMRAALAKAEGRAQ